MRIFIVKWATLALINNKMRTFRVALTLILTIFANYLMFRLGDAIETSICLHKIETFLNERRVQSRQSVPLQRRTQTHTHIIWIQNCAKIVTMNGWYLDILGTSWNECHCRHNVIILRLYSVRFNTLQWNCCVNCCYCCRWCRSMHVDVDGMVVHMTSDSEKQCSSWWKENSLSHTQRMFEISDARNGTNTQSAWQQHRIHNELTTGTNTQIHTHRCSNVNELTCLTVNYTYRLAIAYGAICCYFSNGFNIHFEQTQWILVSAAVYGLTYADARQHFECVLWQTPVTEMNSLK